MPMVAEEVFDGWFAVTAEVFAVAPTAGVPDGVRSNQPTVVSLSCVPV